MNRVLTSEAPLKLFISYSHRDEIYRERLGVHLAALEAEQYMEIWHDRKLVAGNDWAKVIDHSLAEADVVLLLVSPDLISSRYVWGIELEQALRQEAAGKTHIVSVILKPCRWHRAFSPLASRQALPPRLDQVKSVSEHPKGEDKAFDEIIEGLETLCESIRASRHLQDKAPLKKKSPTACLTMTDRLRIIVGRWPRRAGLAALFSLLTLSISIINGQLKYEAEIGWRLLRVGNHASAEARFVRTRWWPGLDAHGSEAARLGRMLAALSDTSQRSDFIPKLEALEKAAPSGSPAEAYSFYLRAVETFERGARQQVPDVWLNETVQMLERAVHTDPQLADAHGLLAALLSLNCQHIEAFAAITAAKQAGGDLAPPRYLVQEAHLLLRRSAPGDAEQARALYEVQSSEAEALLALGMMNLDAARWSEARAALAGATAQLDKQSEHPAWLLPLPGGPLLAGQTAAKRCLLAYASAVSDGLVSQPNQNIANAWRTVTDCTRLEPDAHALVCTHLPEKAATAARDALACPTPQPRDDCPASTDPASPPT